MSLRIMTWNIKGESSLVWNNQYTISRDVVDKIIEQKSDILVLTAFVVASGIDYLFEKLKKMDLFGFSKVEQGKMVF